MSQVVLDKALLYIYQTLHSYVTVITDLSTWVYANSFCLCVLLFSRMLYTVYIYTHTHR